MDYAGGFAAGLLIMLALYIPLVLLALEAWWFWYWSSYGDITQEKLYMLELLIGILILLTVITVRKGVLFLGLLSVPIPLVVWFLMKETEKKTDNIDAALKEKAEIRRISAIIDNAKEPALLYKALVELGDLYAKKIEYEKAIEIYRRADEIVETNKTHGLPGLSFKIKRAEKENRIKKGEIWVCTECSYDNPDTIATCKNCGIVRDSDRKISLRKNRK